ncbi:hypothetical protein N7468_003747 [Penicillium chermesinum]|uniref:Disease resistance R13L4/SHOC-2-like LRR domain-containing protein n=1 Tax=Penicillium chermesinum TaxID=63820 RepID=A0A9W9P9L4_9EURO|nr:uncharacterized protein N7468_003747 [Penicillium chermesinum]KAJ5239128.1 hypothetical protein N7468_003747 [Penicillium chermesinum]
MGHQSNQPWLDSLSDDWESAPATPTTPGPAPNKLRSPKQRTPQTNSPSRIPVAARRPDQQSPASGRKVTRPCHFHRREPPTPKTPRTPKILSKPRSPDPSKLKTKTPTASPKVNSRPSPRPIAKSPRSASKPSAATAVKAGKQSAKQPDVMATRSPLRAVSNVSNQSDYEATDTVQIKPKKSHEGAGTPEWRKRLVRGEIPVGEQRDLFAPMGLESVFKPPTPGSVTQESIAFAKQDDHPWDFTDATSRQGSLMQRDEPDLNDRDSQRASDDEDSGTGMFSPLGTVNRAPWADKRPRADQYTEGLSQGDTDIRTASGLEDLRNEGITPITFTRNNTIEGNGTSEVIKSALKQDLSMGTLDFSRRKGNRPFHQQFSPSPFPSYRIPPKSLANVKTRSSPLFSRSQTNGSPSLPRPSSSHVRPSTSGDAVPRTGAMPSGSPLKLFGEHDTFTNNRLLRRMSQFEETFEDGSDGDEPPSPSEEARRKGEGRGFLNVRHEPLSEITPRRSERSPSRNAQRPRLTRFGDGELDKYDFSDTSPYEHKLVYDESQGLNTRPSSRKRSSGRHYLRRGSREGSIKQTRSASSSFTRKPSAWMRQSYYKHGGDATWSSSRGHNKENIPFAETKRVPKKAADPNPKRRRTVVRETNEAMQQLHQAGELSPIQIRSAKSSKIAPSRQYSESNFDNLDYSDSFSLDGDIPLVKVTGTSDSSRKGSITTQDYLNEATKIMDLIRAKGRPAPGLSSVQESELDNGDPDNDDPDLTYEDESSREAFSRPPSRDGTDLRRKGEFNESAMSLNMHPKHRDGGAGEERRADRLAPGTRKRKPSGPMDDIADTIAQDLMTINTQMSGFSINSVPTGSSQNSQAKGMLSSEMHSWVKPNGQNLAPKASLGEENDPFQDIPDLSVDELQEMMRTNGPESPSKPLSARKPEEATESQPDANLQPGGRAPSVNESSVDSKGSRSSTGPAGTRATSWSTDEVQQKDSHQDLDAHGVQKDSHRTDAPSQSNQGTSLSRTSSHSGREISVGGENFIRRPVSRIDEQVEEGSEYGLVRRESMDVQQTPGPGSGRSLVPVHSEGHDTSYSFHLSPLAEFSVNQPDHLEHSLNLEMSYVAERTHPTSLRQVHGAFALADEDLVKHITDVEPYEPYWEHVRRLALRQKGLLTLHKLGEYCPRLEDLDVSDNEIGQLSGVPTTLRTLKIPRNHLSELTSWGHLSNLQYLDISGNDIETLDGFSSLIHLRELKANDNQIRSIDGILELNGLLSLKLSNNSMTTVDFEGCELTRLRDLDLSHNGLTAVRNIEWLPALATLDLSANQIDLLEPVASLISLRALRISENRLDHLDMKNFPSLSLLYLDHNRLSSISGLGHCHNLEVLSLREQSHPRDPAAEITLDLDLGAVKDIRKVFLSSNQLSSRCLSPSSPLLRLQLLDIAACTLPRLPSDFSSSFPNVKVLNMNFNSLADLEPLVGMNCLSRLTMVGNRLARMRRVCQVLSRLGRNGRNNPCSLQKLDIRGNPLTVGFYRPAVTGSGKQDDRRKLKNQEKAAVEQQKNRRDLSDALTDLNENDHVVQAVTWEEDGKPETDIEVNDPFTLPRADPHADEKYLGHLDRATRLRRKVLELLLYAGTSGSLHTLDGLELRPSLGNHSADMGQAWTKLEELGVLRKKAITDKPSSN